MAGRLPDGYTIHIQAKPVAAVYARALRRLGGRVLPGLVAAPVELSVVLTDDRAIRKLKRLHFGVDRATDVLSFPQGAVRTLGSAGHPLLLGDIVISLDTARREARKRGHNMRAEVELYFIHGLLHLLGHGHDTRRDAAEMAREEVRLLGGAGLVKLSYLSKARRPKSATSLLP